MQAMLPWGGFQPQILMAKNTNKVKSTNARLAVVLVVGVVILAAIWVGWDLTRGHQRSLDCGDGQRYSIDVRQFATQYSAYSLQLEASLNDKSKISLKLDPVQLEKLSEAMQSANEFRKYVVAGFNSCAITKVQYAQVEARFQALDSLAREINGLAAQPSHSADESARLTALISQYSDLAHKLGTE
jgi:hypothetical protein